MDLDAYVRAHQNDWHELESLVKRQRLNAVESDRLVDLYQRVGTHLSVLRSVAPEPTLLFGLSALLDKARRKASTRRAMTWRDYIQFFTKVVPAGLYSLRWWWIITGVASLAFAVGYGAWLMANPTEISSIATPEMIDQLVNHDFEHYYSEYAANHFAFMIWVNNSWVALQCIALGVLGFPIVYILINNLLNLGLMGAIMTANGRADVFWGLITPHGLLELTAVFVAAAAGLKLFWSWVSPGSRTRLESLAREGRRTVAIGLGLIVVLGISGLVEAFVTPSPLPTWARIGVGVLVWVAFLAYALVLGRRAVDEGFDGDISVEDREEQILTAA